MFVCDEPHRNNHHPTPQKRPPRSAHLDKMTSNLDDLDPEKKRSGFALQRPRHRIPPRLPPIPPPIPSSPPLHRPPCPWRHQWWEYCSRASKHPRRPWQRQLEHLCATETGETKDSGILTDQKATFARGRKYVQGQNGTDDPWAHHRTVGTTVRRFQGQGWSQTHPV